MAENAEKAEKAVAEAAEKAEKALDPDRRQLLKENAETGEWEPPNGETIGTVHLWRHRTANLVACRINTQKINSLEVMTRECTEAFARARTQRHQEAVATMEKNS